MQNKEKEADGGNWKSSFLSQKNRTWDM